jgi:hypothetical protein
MGTSQYNFKVEDELKEQLEVALLDSGAENKSEFLALMLETFKVHQTNIMDIDIDLSNYELINKETKLGIKTVFKHMLITLESNYSNLKQEKISIENDRKNFQESEKNYKIEIEKAQAILNQTLLDFEDTKLVINKQYTEQIQRLENENNKLVEEKVIIEENNKKILSELKNMSKMVEQVEFITSQNKQLMLKNQELEKNHKTILKSCLDEKDELLAEKLELEKINYKNELIIEQNEKEISKSKIAYTVETDKNTELQNKIILIDSKYNKTLGKLEILQEEKNNYKKLINYNGTPSEMK